MKVSKYIYSILITLLVLAFFEVVSTALIPSLGITSYRPSFDVIIILFLGLRLNGTFLPPMILLIELFHSTFTIEGWAHGTFAAIIVCLIIERLKGILHLTSYFITIVTVQILQCLWFLIETILIYVRTSDFHRVADRFWHFLPESIIISIFSPLFFSLLEKIWKPRPDQIGGEA